MYYIFRPIWDSCEIEIILEKYNGATIWDTSQCVVKSGKKVDNFGNSTLMTNTTESWLVPGDQIQPLPRCQSMYYCIYMAYGYIAKLNLEEDKQKIYHVSVSKAQVSLSPFENQYEETYTEFI